MVNRLTDKITTTMVNCPTYSQGLWTRVLLGLIMGLASVTNMIQEKGQKSVLVDQNIHKSLLGRF
jgi:hypothetical protein